MFIKDYDYSYKDVNIFIDCIEENIDMAKVNLYFNSKSKAIRIKKNDNDLFYVGAEKIFYLHPTALNNDNKATDILIKMKRG